MCANRLRRNLWAEATQYNCEIVPLERTETLILELLQVIVLKLLSGDLEGLLQVVIRVFLGTAGISSAGRNGAHIGVGASHTSLWGTRREKRAKQARVGVRKDRTYKLVWRIGRFYVFILSEKRQRRQIEMERTADNILSKETGT